MKQLHIIKLEYLDKAIHAQRSLVELGLQSEVDLVIKLRELNKLLLELLEELQNERKANSDNQQV